MLIATAGHVDHGKTTLINALTGVDTDRLPEEKKRGLTIELGFAYVDAPDDRVVGFVDVPGHEKFIRNMAAGVGAIDIALLVVAADDGVMPQTREHVAILDLFGVTGCVIAITRIDLVDVDTVERVRREAQALVAASELEMLGSAAVSAPGNVGITELFDLLVGRGVEWARKRRPGAFRLAVDRSFTVHGSGTVVTGAVFSGEVAEGDSVQLLPGGKTARVRGIHANGREQHLAVAGQRAALNLAGIDTTEANRGDWVTQQGLDVVTGCADVRVRVLKTESRALRHWTPVHVHAGSAATTGRIALYEKRSVDAGVEAFAQLVLQQPLHLLYGDRFVIRDQTASRTIGGGTVLDPFASRHRSFRKDRLPALQALQTDDPAQALVSLLTHSEQGIDVQKFNAARNLDQQQSDRLAQLSDVRCIEDSDGIERYFDARRVDSTVDMLVQRIALYHDEQPASIGLEPELLSRDTRIAQGIFDVALAEALALGRLKRTGVRLGLPDHQPRLDDDQQRLLEKILALVQPDMTKPPPLSELAEKLGVERATLSEAVDPLVQAGHIIRVAENRVYHPEALDTLAKIAKDLSEQSRPRGFDAKAFRDSSGIGRNISIDVLEYFDRVGLTRRLADRRTFRTQSH